MHDLQNKILKTLLLNEKSRFTELNVDNITSDHFNFHIKRLLELKFILKDKQGFYYLTDKGKEYANRLDVDSGKIEIERQAKIAVLVICTKIESGVKKYLIQKRLKHPFYGYCGFISGKIKWGELVSGAAKRELKEEIGVEGSLRLAGVEHKIDYNKNNKLLEDKYFYVFEATDPKGELLREFEAGENFWMTKNEINKIFELFDDVLPLMGLIKEQRFNFLEKKYIVDRY
jgi:ADP-ribose pyrophosphatase YjhB (NUDIX family)